LGATESPIQLATGALTPWVTRPGREVDHSPTSGAQVKNVWSYTFTPQ